MRSTPTSPDKTFNPKRFARTAVIVLPATLIIIYVIFSIYSAFTYTHAPNRDFGPDTPATYSMPYENVSFASAADDKLTIRGWFIPNPHSQRALILVHGQNGTRSERLDLSLPLWQSGYSVLLMDMRGHGQSDGDHYTLGLYEQWDIVGAAKFLQGRGFQPTSIGAMGWSMGAASVIMAFGQTSDIKAIVSDSGYANLSSLDGLLYPGMLIACRLFRGLDLEQIKPEVAITKTGNRHALLIQGDHDRNVSVENAYILKRAGGVNVDLWIVPGATHVASYPMFPQEYLQRVLGFLARELV